MAFPLQLLALILREHLVLPLPDPVITLGRQRVDCTHSQMLDMFRANRVDPAPLPPGTNMNNLDTVFFAHLGLKMAALDVSAHEGAEILASLNDPLPKNLFGIAGTVIDGGTIEHIFDMKQAFFNIVQLLRVGGRVIHLPPVNNWVNHGFVQISPTLFFDYYQKNHFDDLRATMIVQHRDDLTNLPWGFIDYDHDNMYGGCNYINDEKNALVMMFRATKMMVSTWNKIPTQKIYSGEVAFPPRRNDTNVFVTDENNNIRCLTSSSGVPQ